MARPTKNNCDYFSHDNDMRNDDKIRAIRRKFGNDGYAVWNMLLEVLCKSEHFFLKLDNVKLETLSGDFEVDSDLLSKMLDYYVSINLLKVYYCIQKPRSTVPEVDYRTQKPHSTTPTTADVQKTDEKYYFCFNMAKRLMSAITRRNEVIVDENICPTELLHTLIQLKLVSVSNNPQTKVKESKLKKTKRESGALTQEEQIEKFKKVCKIVWNNDDFVKKQSDSLGVLPSQVQDEIQVYVNHHIARPNGTLNNSEKSIMSDLKNWFKNKAAFTRTT